MNIDSNTQVFLGNTEIVEIRKGNVTIWEKSSTPVIDYLYVKNESNNQNTLTLYVQKQYWGTSFEPYAARSVDYSTDRNSWTTASLDSNVTIALGVGESVYFRNIGAWSYKQGESSYAAYKIIRFNCSDYFSVGGNVMSLLDYTNIDTVNLRNYCFCQLFQNATKLVNSNALILPATTLQNYCYSRLFLGCSEMISTTTLPATTLVTGCYSNMYQNCSSLNTIKTYANNISASDCLKNWLYGVSATGDFYNLGGATYDSGVNGIPSGWTEHTSL